MDKKIIVVGSNSFSGAYFVKHAIENGYQVVGISRSNEYDPVFLPYKWNKQHEQLFSFYSLDLNHDLEKIMELVQSFRPDYIVNFAAQSMVAQSWEHPEHWFMTNVVSTIKLHHHLINCDFLKKYVHVSTPEVYGSCQGLIKEHTHYNPSTPYAVSRAAADLSLMTFFHNYNFPVIFTRAANVYGPGQQLYRIIPRAVLFFLTGRTLELHGGGTSVRSFIHMEDVSDGTLKAMEMADPPEIFHLSTKENISIRALVEKVAELMDVSIEKHIKIVGERPGKDAAYLLDSDHARQSLGWDDTMGLEQGILQTIDWCRDNLDQLLKHPVDYIHKP